jgi:hypothetical protein
MQAGTSARSAEGLFEVRIMRNEHGQGTLTPQPLYRRPGDAKLFVAASEGPYVIQVRNLSPGRLECLLDVDGRDVFAEAAADLRESSGYVLHAGEIKNFTGFRIDDDSVYEFEFGKLAGGVAETATGSSEGSGIIGVAAYREYRPYVAPYAGGSDYRLESAVAGAAPQTMGAPVMRGMPKGSGAGAGVEPDMSTHLGQQASDPVGRTTFRRAGEPVVLAIGYASYAVLEAANLTGPAEPQPFPGRGTGYRALKERTHA